MPKTEEQPPCLDAFAVDLLRHETWRAMICHQIKDGSPQAGAVARTPAPQGLSPVPASPFNISSLAAHGLAMVGRLILGMSMFVAFGCQGCA